MQAFQQRILSWAINKVTAFVEINPGDIHNPSSILTSGQLSFANIRLRADVLNDMLLPDDARQLLEIGHCAVGSLVISLPLLSYDASSPIEVTVRNVQASASLRSRAGYDLSAEAESKKRAADAVGSSYKNTASSSIDAKVEGLMKQSLEKFFGLSATMENDQNQKSGQHDDEDEFSDQPQQQQQQQLEKPQASSWWSAITNTVSSFLPPNPALRPIKVNLENVSVKVTANGQSTVAEARVSSVQVSYNDTKNSNSSSTTSSPASSTSSPASSSQSPARESSPASASSNKDTKPISISFKGMQVSIVRNNNNTNINSSANLIQQNNNNNNLQQQQVVLRGTISANAESFMAPAPRHKYAKYRKWTAVIATFNAAVCDDVSLILKTVQDFGSELFVPPPMRPFRKYLLVVAQEQSPTTVKTENSTPSLVTATGAAVVLTRPKALFMYAAKSVHSLIKDRNTRYNMNVSSMRELRFVRVAYLRLLAEVYEDGSSKEALELRMADLVNLEQSVKHQDVVLFLRRTALNRATQKHLDKPQVHPSVPVPQNELVVGAKTAHHHATNLFGVNVSIPTIAIKLPLQFSLLVKDVNALFNSTGLLNKGAAGVGASVGLVELVHNTINNTNNENNSDNSTSTTFSPCLVIRIGKSAAATTTTSSISTSSVTNAAIQLQGMIPTRAILSGGRITLLAQNNNGTSDNKNSTEIDQQSDWMSQTGGGGARLTQQRSGNAGFPLFGGANSEAPSRVSTVSSRLQTIGRRTQATGIQEFSLRIASSIEVHAEVMRLASFELVPHIIHAQEQAKHLEHMKNLASRITNLISLSEATKVRNPKKNKKPNAAPISAAKPEVTTPVTATAVENNKNNNNNNNNAVTAEIDEFLKAQEQQVNSAPPAVFRFDAVGVFVHFPELLGTSIVADQIRGTLPNAAFERERQMPSSEMPSQFKDTISTKIDVASLKIFYLTKSQQEINIVAIQVTSRSTVSVTDLVLSGPVAKGTANFSKEDNKSFPLIKLEISQEYIDTIRKITKPTIEKIKKDFEKPKEDSNNNINETKKNDNNSKKAKPQQSQSPAAPVVAVVHPRPGIELFVPGLILLVKLTTDEPAIASPASSPTIPRIPLLPGAVRPFLNLRVDALQISLPPVLLVDNIEQNIDEAGNEDCGTAKPASSSASSGKVDGDRRSSQQGFDDIDDNDNANNNENDDGGAASNSLMTDIDIAFASLALDLPYPASIRLGSSSVAVKGGETTLALRDLSIGVQQLVPEKHTYSLGAAQTLGVTILSSGLTNINIAELSLLDRSVLLEDLFVGIQAIPGVVVPFDRPAVGSNIDINAAIRFVDVPAARLCPVLKIVGDIYDQISTLVWDAMSLKAKGEFMSALSNIHVVLNEPSDGTTTALRFGDAEARLVRWPDVTNNNNNSAPSRMSSYHSLDFEQQQQHTATMDTTAFEEKNIKITATTSVHQLEQTRLVLEKIALEERVFRRMKPHILKKQREQDKQTKRMFAAASTELIAAATNNALAANNNNNASPTPSSAASSFVHSPGSLQNTNSNMNTTVLQDWQQQQQELSIQEKRKRKLKEMMNISTIERFSSRQGEENGGYEDDNDNDNDNDDAVTTSTNATDETTESNSYEYYLPPTRSRLLSIDILMDADDRRMDIKISTKANRDDDVGKSSNVIGAVLMLLEKDDADGIPSKKNTQSKKTSAATSSSSSSCACLTLALDRFILTDAIGDPNPPVYWVKSERPPVLHNLNIRGVALNLFDCSTKMISNILNINIPEISIRNEFVPSTSSSPLSQYSIMEKFTTLAPGTQVSIVQEVLQLSSPNSNNNNGILHCLEFLSQHWLPPLTASLKFTREVPLDVRKIQSQGSFDLIEYNAKKKSRKQANDVVAATTSTTRYHLGEDSAVFVPANSGSYTIFASAADGVACSVVAVIVDDLNIKKNTNQKETDAATSSIKLDENKIAAENGDIALTIPERDPPPKLVASHISVGDILVSFDILTIQQQQNQSTRRPSSSADLFIDSIKIDIDHSRKVDLRALILEKQKQLSSEVPTTTTDTSLEITNIGIQHVVLHLQHRELLSLKHIGIEIKDKNSTLQQQSIINIVNHKDICVSVDPTSSSSNSSQNNNHNSNIFVNALDLIDFGKDIELMTSMAKNQNDNNNNQEGAKEGSLTPAQQGTVENKNNNNDKNITKLESTIAKVSKTSFKMMDVDTEVKSSQSSMSLRVDLLCSNAVNNALTISIGDALIPLLSISVASSLATNTENTNSANNKIFSPLLLLNQNSSSVENKEKVSEIEVTFKSTCGLQAYSTRRENVVKNCNISAYFRSVDNNSTNGFVLADETPIANNNLISASFDVSGGQFDLQWNHPPIITWWISQLLKKQQSDRVKNNSDVDRHQQTVIQFIDRTGYGFGLTSQKANAPPQGAANNDNSTSAPISPGVLYSSNSTSSVFSATASSNFNNNATSTMKPATSISSSSASASPAPITVSVPSFGIVEWSHHTLDESSNEDSPINIFINNNNNNHHPLLIFDYFDTLIISSSSSSASSSMSTKLQIPPLRCVPSFMPGEYTNRGVEYDEALSFCSPLIRFSKGDRAVFLRVSRVINNERGNVVVFELVSPVAIQNVLVSPRSNHELVKMRILNARNNNNNNTANNNNSAISTALNDGGQGELLCVPILDDQGDGENSTYYDDSSLTLQLEIPVSAAADASNSAKMLYNATLPFNGRSLAQLAAAPRLFSSSNKAASSKCRARFDLNFTSANTTKHSSIFAFAELFTSAYESCILRVRPTVQIRNETGIPLRITVRNAGGDSAQESSPSGGNNNSKKIRFHTYRGQGNGEIVDYDSNDDYFCEDEVLTPSSDNNNNNSIVFNDVVYAAKELVPSLPPWMNNNTINEVGVDEMGKCTATILNANPAKITSLRLSTQILNNNNNSNPNSPAAVSSSPSTSSFNFTEFRTVPFFFPEVADSNESPQVIEFVVYATSGSNNNNNNNNTQMGLKKVFGKWTDEGRVFVLTRAHPSIDVTSSSSTSSSSSNSAPSSKSTTNLNENTNKMNSSSSSSSKPKKADSSLTPQILQKNLGFTVIRNTLPSMISITHQKYQPSRSGQDGNLLTGFFSALISSASSSSSSSNTSRNMSSASHSSNTWLTPGSSLSLPPSFAVSRENIDFYGEDYVADEYVDAVDGSMVAAAAARTPSDNGQGGSSDKLGIFLPGFKANEISLTNFFFGGQGNTSASSSSDVFYVDLESEDNIANSSTSVARIGIVKIAPGWYDIVPWCVLVNGDSSSLMKKNNDANILTVSNPTADLLVSIVTGSRTENAGYETMWRRNNNGNNKKPHRHFPLLRFSNKSNTTWRFTPVAKQNSSKTANNNNNNQQHHMSAATKEVCIAAALGFSSNAASPTSPNNNQQQQQQQQHFHQDEQRLLFKRVQASIISDHNKNNNNTNNNQKQLHTVLLSFSHSWWTTTHPCCITVRNMSSQELTVSPMIFSATPSSGENVNINNNSHHNTQHVPTSKLLHARSCAPADSMTIAASAVSFFVGSADTGLVQEVHCRFDKNTKSYSGVIVDTSSSTGIVPTSLSFHLITTEPCGNRRKDGSNGNSSSSSTRYLLYITNFNDKVCANGVAAAVPHSADLRKHSFANKVFDPLFGIHFELSLRNLRTTIHGCGIPRSTELERFASASVSRCNVLVRNRTSLRSIALTPFDLRVFEISAEVRDLAITEQAEESAAAVGSGLVYRRAYGGLQPISASAKTVARFMKLEQQNVHHHQQRTTPLGCLIHIAPLNVSEVNASVGFHIKERALLAFPLPYLLRLINKGLIRNSNRLQQQKEMADQQQYSALAITAREKVKELEFVGIIDDYSPSAASTASTTQKTTNTTATTTTGGTTTTKKKNHHPYFVGGFVLSYSDLVFAELSISKVKATISVTRDVGYSQEEYVKEKQSQQQQQDQYNGSASPGSSSTNSSPFSFFSSRQQPSSVGRRRPPPAQEFIFEYDAHSIRAPNSLTGTIGGTTSSSSLQSKSRTSVAGDGYYDDDEQELENRNSNNNNPFAMPKFQSPSRTPILVPNFRPISSSVLHRVGMPPEILLIKITQHLVISSAGQVSRNIAAAHEVIGSPLGFIGNALLASISDLVRRRTEDKAVVPPTALLPMFASELVGKGLGALASFASGLLSNDDDIAAANRSAMLSMMNLNDSQSNRQKAATTDDEFESLNSHWAGLAPSQNFTRSVVQTSSSSSSTSSASTTKMSLLISAVLENATASANGISSSTSSSSSTVVEGPERRPYAAVRCALACSLHDLLTCGDAKYILRCLPTAIAASRLRHAFANRSRLRVWFAKDTIVSEVMLQQGIESANIFSTLSNPSLERQIISGMYRQQSLSAAMKVQKQNFFSSNNATSDAIKQRQHQEQFISILTMYNLQQSASNNNNNLKPAKRISNNKNNDYFFNNDEDNNNNNGDDGEDKSKSNNNKDMIFTLMELRYLLLQTFAAAQLLKTYPPVRSYLINCCQNAVQQKEMK